MMYSMESYNGCTGTMLGQWPHGQSRRTLKVMSWTLRGISFVETRIYDSRMSQIIRILLTTKDKLLAIVYCKEGAGWVEQCHMHQLVCMRT